MQSQNIKPLRGKIYLPGDKSITHRALMFAALATGNSRVQTSVIGRDNLGTLRILGQLGVASKCRFNEAMLRLAVEEGIASLEKSNNEYCEIEINGQGWNSFVAPREILDCGNSGTTARLLTGILSGRPFVSTLTGDESLRRRPFRRVTEPLTRMGASFSGDMLPLAINGGGLHGLHYESQHASAQVKSAIILAGLQASGDVVVTEPRKSRDHTERMLEAMGCKLQCTAKDNGKWEVALLDRARPEKLNALDVSVPGDFSAAAFFMVLGCIVPGSEIVLCNVGFNETRFGLYTLLKRMGAKIQVINQRVVGGEEVVDLVVSSSTLNAIEVTSEDVVLAIDEVPIFCVAAAFADGVTEISGAEELRVKESDRLKMIWKVLNSFGIEATEKADGITIIGSPERVGNLRGQDLSMSRTAWIGSGDHRVAMSGAVMEYALSGSFELQDAHAVETSFPSFVECFKALGAPIW